VQDAKALVPEIRASYGLLAACYAAQQNLSFARKTVQSAIELLMGEQTQWQVGEMPDEETKADYSTTMTNRFTNIMRAVGQSVSKDTKASWVYDLPWMDSSARPADRKSAGSEPAVDIRYNIKFDSLLRTAVR
jgi:hypothetical protein